MTERLIRIPPPAYALLLLALSHGLAVLVPLPLDLSAPWSGGLLMLAGLALSAWAMLHFRIRRTTPIPAGQPTSLVIEGPYRYTRNPMYLGVLLILAGIALYWGDAAYFLAPAGFFLIVDRLFIPYEEEKLARLFGPNYERLMRATPRWWGRRCGK